MLSYKVKKDSPNDLKTIYDKNSNKVVYNYSNSTLIPSYYDIEDIREMLIINVVRN
jgi:hypothetical protein